MSGLYAEVIGDPIAHSKSPLIHNFWLAKLGIDAEYRACLVKPEELADYFARRRGDAEWQGCNVTLPHKESIAALVDEVAAGVSAIGAINTVAKTADGRLLGKNTDIDGIAAATAGISLTGSEVVVIGAGGAARAAFAFLAKQNCAAVRSLARTPEKAIRAAAPRPGPAP